MNKVFLSYRRRDIPQTTGRIYDRLKSRYGKEQIFKDVQSLPAGANFREYILKALKQCTVQLVIIGPNWLNAVDDDGKPRLYNPDDTVRLEIEVAMEHGILIIPVLADGAVMPHAEQLPPSLSPLVFHHALPIRVDPDFDVDIENLFVEIENQGEVRYVPGWQVYPNVNDAQFVSDIESLATRTNELTIIAPAGFIMQGNIHDIVLRRAQAGELTVTLCFGNPFSPHLRDRLIEEERATSKPDIGLGGIIRRVENMLDEMGELTNVRILLFDNYPTMCIMNFDDRYAFYPLGYRTLGNRCPVIADDVSSQLGRFLQTMSQLILADAFEAQEIFRVRYYKAHDTNFLRPTNICTVEIQGVLDPSSAFSHTAKQWFGNQNAQSIGVPETVEDDRVFLQSHLSGLTNEPYVTLTDTMFFDARQLPSLVLEVQQIASLMHTVPLNVDCVSSRESWADEYALMCLDASGVLESLDAELAARIRPRALGSQFTLGASEHNINTMLDERAKLMLDLYQTPYVFSRHRPRIRLGRVKSELTEQDRHRLDHITASYFREYLDEGKQISVSHLCVRHRPIGSLAWERVVSGELIKLSQ